MTFKQFGKAEIVEARYAIVTV